MLSALRSTFAKVIVWAPESLPGRDHEVLLSLEHRVLLGTPSTVSCADLLAAVVDVEVVPGSTDEIVVTDDGWFGPTHPLGPLLDHMSDVADDAWMMTDPANPLGQLSWTCVRRNVLEEVDIRGLPVACLWSEAGESQSLLSSVVAFPGRAVLSSMALSDLSPDRVCPLLASDLFCADPVLLADLHASARSGMRLLEQAGSPIDAVVSRVIRRASPRTLNVNLGLISVVPDLPDMLPAGEEPPCLVHLHVEPHASTRRVRGILGTVPPSARVIVTAGETEMERVRRELEPVEQSVRYLVVDPGSGQIGALVRACAGGAEGAADEVLIALRAGHTTGDTPVARRVREEQTQRALFASSAHVRAVLGMFLREELLGFVTSPTQHLGSADLGAGWGGREEVARRMCRELGVLTPLGSSPIEPPEGMWFSRRLALAPVLNAQLTDEDYARDLREGSVLTALLPHFAAAAGFYTRTVLDPRTAGISHANLEYELDQISSTITGPLARRIALLQRIGDVGSGGLWNLARTIGRVLVARGQGSGDDRS